MLQEIIEGSSTIANFQPDQFGLLPTGMIQEVVTYRISLLGSVADKRTEDFYRKREEFYDEREALRKLPQELDPKTPPKTGYSELNQLKDDSCKLLLDIKTYYSKLDQLRDYCCEALVEQRDAIKLLSDDYSTIKKCLTDSMAKCEERERIEAYRKGIRNYRDSIGRHEKRENKLTIYLVGVDDSLKRMENQLEIISKIGDEINKYIKQNGGKIK